MQKKKMAPKAFNKCVFWLILLCFIQFVLMLMAFIELFYQLKVSPNTSNNRMMFRIGTSLLILFNFHIQLRKTSKCSYGYQSKRSSLILVFISCIIAFTYFLLYLFESIFFEPDPTPNSSISKHALIASASFWLLWLSFSIHYYKIYEFIDDLVTINNDNAIPLTEKAARSQYRVLECERAYLGNGFLFRRLFSDCPVEHAEYLFLQKTIDALEKFKFAPKNMKRLDEIILEIKLRAEKFSGVSGSDKQKYVELATQFPKIIEPTDDPYYEYDRRVLHNKLCVNSKSSIWGSSRNTII